MKKAIKTLTFLFVLLMTAVMMPQMTLQASTAPSSEYVKITKHKSFNKDGKFYMSFTIENLQKPVDVGGLLLGEQLLIDVSIMNSSGNRVQYWNTLPVTAGQKKAYNFGTNFSELPTGTYTLKLRVSAILEDAAWVWTYNINHKAAKSSISFKPYETYYDKDGRYMHKFRVQCNNMKGKALTLKIYDEYGDLVYSIAGSKRVTNSEVAWFGWSGYSNGVRYPSGSYTAVVTGDGKSIKGNYYLEILERAEG